MDTTINKQGFFFFSLHNIHYCITIKRCYITACLIQLHSLALRDTQTDRYISLMHWIHEKYIISLMFIHWSSSDLNAVKRLNKLNAFMCPLVASQAKNWYHFWGMFNLTYHDSDHNNCVWGHMQLTRESTWPLSVLRLDSMSSSVSLSRVSSLSCVIWIKAD